MTIIDARGLSCPQPVILTQKAFKEGKVPFSVKVDNEIAVENIKRFAHSQKLTVEVATEDDDYTITLK
ncbi:MAG: sulfurtransferase TusA family protein [Synergistaceae bacterium]